MATREDRKIRYAVVRVVAAIGRALESGRPETLAPLYRSKRPPPDQRFDLPPAARPRLVHAATPGGAD